MTRKAQNNSIGNLFIQICKLRRNRSNALLSDAGIHEGQDALLYYLSIEDGQTVSALAEKLCIQHATIFNMVDRMVANEFVTKEKDANDKRTSRIFLTTKGEEAMKQVAKVWRTMEAQTINGLAEEEITTIAALLRKVLFNLK
jgi:DNA-binding MarR family transcriptional regulator